MFKLCCDHSTDACFTQTQSPPLHCSSEYVSDCLKLGWEAVDSAWQGFFRQATESFLPFLSFPFCYNSSIFAPRKEKGRKYVENDYRIETVTNSPVSVVINGFYPKTGA